jgi:hypothetical protein
VNNALTQRYQAFFEDFNQRFFNGKLPHYQIQLVSDVLGLLRTRSGERIPFDCDRAIYRRERIINLNAKLSQEELTSTLIHEMAHARTNDYHGLLWQKEMERLILMGAPVDADEYTPMTEEYASERLREMLEDNPNIDLEVFAGVFVRIERRARSVRALLEAYPWIRKFFEKPGTGIV